MSVKFTQNKRLKRKLLKSYPKEIVEATRHDTIWGIGLSTYDPRAKDKSHWRGENLLGQCLTSVRDELMKTASIGEELMTTESSDESI